MINSKMEMPKVRKIISYNAYNIRCLFCILKYVYDINA